MWISVTREYRDLYLDAYCDAALSLTTPRIPVTRPDVADENVDDPTVTSHVGDKDVENEVRPHTKDEASNDDDATNWQANLTITAAPMQLWMTKTMPNDQLVTKASHPLDVLAHVARTCFIMKITL